MGFSFHWDDEDQKTVVRYTAHGDWNWNDYHKTVQMSLFSFQYLDHSVDVVVDLSGTEHMPRGALRHLRTIGQRRHPNLTGRAVVIGLDAELEAQLLAGNDERVLRVGEQVIHFVDDEDEAQALLAAFRTSE